MERPIALGLLVGLAPIWLTAGVCVWTLSRRSPLIALRRVGQDGVRFWTLKLRTMWSPAKSGGKGPFWLELIDSEAVPEVKTAEDPRVTSRFARFLRKHSIDELPQLVHVVLGQMSLVGPRPLTENELYRFYGSAAAEIVQVKPGLTGLWQIRGRNRLTYRERRRLDLFLVRNLGAGLFASILLQTLPRVLSGKDAC